MDPRVGLLKEFYRGLPLDRAKVETDRHGFDFLEQMLSDGAQLEYGESTPVRRLHKYKLTDIPAQRMDELLRSHIDRACNLCLYFGSPQSSLFCFNLDHNETTSKGGLIPEIEFTVRALREELTGLGCAPLIVSSGRGYHLWGRLSAPVENERLFDFMFGVAVQVLAWLARGDVYDRRKVKFNLYPNPRNRDRFSLRLFGTAHAKNKVFSRVLAGEELLDEAASWAYFKRYLESQTVPLATFAAACGAIAAGKSRPPPSSRSPVAARLAKWARSIQKPQ